MRGTIALRCKQPVQGTGDRHPGSHDAGEDDTPVALKGFKAAGHFRGGPVTGPPRILTGGVGAVLVIDHDYPGNTSTTMCPCKRPST